MAAVEREPMAELLALPEGYGKPKRTLAWPTVRRMLEEARNYWLATVRADGRPHVVPLDGVWVDDVWYHGGGPDTVHRRTVAANPEVVMHLEDPMKVVIVEGVVRTTDTTADLAERLAAATNEKYAEYGEVAAGNYAEATGLYPRRVLAWTSFPTDVTRFVFPSSGKGS